MIKTKYSALVEKLVQNANTGAVHPNDAFKAAEAIDELVNQLIAIRATFGFMSVRHESESVLE